MNNSVFISYRRSISGYFARAVYQDLRANDIDVFMDVESIDAGTFDTIILNQIAARPYFLLLLTPGTLDRCIERGDWLLREIDHAMKLNRVVVPLISDKFDFKDAKKFLEDPIASDLPRFNAVSVPYDYFDAAMDKLRTRFLRPTDVHVTPIPKADELMVKQRVAEANAEAIVTPKQLSAQEYFERAFTNFSEGDFEGAIADCNEAISLDPNYTNAYIGRGVALKALGDVDGAIADYNEAIRLNPNDNGAYFNRAIVREAQGDVDGAIADYNEAIRLNPNDADAFFKRGSARRMVRDIDGAIADYNEAIRLNPNDAEAYDNRGLERYYQWDMDGAIADYNEAIRLNPNDAEVYNNRGLLHFVKGDIDSAVADYREALLCDPSYAEPYRHLSECWEVKKDYKSAITEGQKFLEFVPHYLIDAGIMRDNIARWHTLTK